MAAGTIIATARVIMSKGPRRSGVKSSFIKRRANDLRGTLEINEGALPCGREYSTALTDQKYISARPSRSASGIHCFFLVMIMLPRAV
jgi:hypothetical protein